MLIESIVGTLVGLLGTGLTTYSNYKMEQLRANNKLKELELQGKLLRLEAEASIQLAVNSAQLNMMEQESEAFTESQRTNKKVFSENYISALLSQKGWRCIFTIPVGLLLTLLLGLGDVLQHSMRSVLTIYCLCITSWVTYQCYMVLDKLNALDPFQASLGWQDAREVVFLLTVTMVSWWFGDRRVATHLMHMRRGAGNGR